MTFYTYNYITQHSQFNNAVWYALSFLALAALLFVSIKYLRNRLVSRYRDLIVILFLAVAFLGGMQWNDYNRTKSDVEATSRMAQFLVDVQGTFYAVTFNADFTSFQYERTHLLGRDVKIADKED